MDNSSEHRRNYTYSLTLDLLPDDVLLKIFEYINFEDLCQCSQVSRKWRSLTQSLFLKEVVIDRHLEQYDMCLLFQHPYITNNLESFKYINNQVTYLDESEFILLKKNCYNLKKLTLRKCAIKSGSINNLPASLKHLSLWKCMIDPYEVFRRSMDVVGITCLDLSGVNTSFTSNDMPLLLRLKNLQCLYLENCFRINNGGIEWIIDLLPQLQILDLEGTCISNEIVQPILCNGSKLKELYLGYTCIDELAFLKPLSHSACLRTLCIRNTNVSFSFIGQLMSLFNDKVCILDPFKSGSCVNQACTSHVLIKQVPLNVQIADYKCCYHYLHHVCP